MSLKLLRIKDHQCELSKLIELTMRKLDQVHCQLVAAMKPFFRQALEFQYRSCNICVVCLEEPDCEASQRWCSDRSEDDFHCRYEVNYSPCPQTDSTCHQWRAPSFATSDSRISLRKGFCTCSDPGKRRCICNCRLLYKRSRTFLRGGLGLLSWHLFHSHLEPHCPFSRPRPSWHFRSST